MDILKIWKTSFPKRVNFSLFKSHTARDVPWKVTHAILRMEEGSFGAVFEHSDTVGALAEGLLAGALGEQPVLLADVGHAALLLCGGGFWF